MKESDKRLKIVQADPFIKYNRRGQVCQINCKVCGLTIATEQQRGLIRNKHYAEIKIQFDDKTSHVMNMCISCVTEHRTNQDILMAAYQADVDEMARDVPAMRILSRDKFKPKVVTVDTSLKGIL